MAHIHPTAVVDPKAEIAGDAFIGPLCVVGPHVSIGGGTRLLSQCTVMGHTTMGRNNIVYPGACLGGEPQDYGFKGDVSFLRIGDGNLIRECVTVHVGTKPGSETRIGDGCMLMVSSHLGHNCVLGNKVILANCALLAGYVSVGDNCFISGLTAARQFCRIGRFAMMWGLSAISKDLPPFMIVNGRNGAVPGINVIGLRRAGFTVPTIAALRQVHKIFYREGLGVKNALERIKSDVPPLPEVLEFIQFVESSERGVLLGRDTRGKHNAAVEEEDDAIE
ncbi:acyl-ACP--UDP-N-acetylglucosamine O-acyltransferase [bacterium]|nr:acyl-ACP--UDP-N-acetylglucosamine O-acyltransferase [bacterium]